jgi:outer membrane protein TolC
MQTGTARSGWGFILTVIVLLSPVSYDFDNAIIHRSQMLNYAIVIPLRSTAAMAQMQPTPGSPVEVEAEEPIKPEDMQSRVTLDELIKEAMEKNPAIQAAQDLAAARRARVSPEKTLPNPTIGFQTMGDLVPPTLQKGDPSSGRFYSITQEIPFPGKLGLRGEVALTEAEAQVWNQKQAVLEVTADLKKAFYDYLFIYQSIEVVLKDKELLDNIAEVAEARYRVGEGAQQDVIKAQVEISKLLDRMTVLEQRQETAQALINRLLYRSPGTPVGIPVEVKQTELAYSQEELIRLAEANSPVLQVQEQNIARNRFGVELAGKEYYPDFEMGFTYVDRDDEPTMYGLTASAKIPLYFWRKERPALEAARLELSAARKERESVASRLGYDVKEAYITATSSNKLARLYKTTLIPQARLAVESAFASYQVGIVDFLTVLDSIVTLLEYELKYYETLTDYMKAMAQLELVTGMELVRK